MYKIFQSLSLGSIFKNVKLAYLLLHHPHLLERTFTLTTCYRGIFPVNGSPLVYDENSIYGPLCRRPTSKWVSSPVSPSSFSFHLSCTFRVCERKNERKTECSPTVCPGKCSCYVPSCRPLQTRPL